MKIVYAQSDLPESFSKSIFLAGPTPRSEGIQSWRHEALAILEALNYDGVVFVPENPPGGGAFDDWGKSQQDYKDVVKWEKDALNMSDCIVFWVPRNMESMPALTTNDEWGYYKTSGKVVFGAPPKAAKVRYQKYWADKLDVPVADSLVQTLQNAIELVGKGGIRYGGCRNIPMFIWKTKHMQNWAKNHFACGNRLDHAEVLWRFGVGPGKKIPFAYIIHMDIYVKKEDRNKSNEFVFFRPDISSVVLFKKAEELEDTEIVLIKEFRSPVNNEECMVYEVPGGSSFKENIDPAKLASDEVKEETGITIAPGRFSFFKARQVAATLSSHKSYLFTAELNEDEMAQAKSLSESGKWLGEENTSERCYMHVTTIGKLLHDNFNVDWSMMGMILRAVI